MNTKVRKGYDRMAAGVGKPTSAGAVTEIKLYAYPSGHGNVVVDGTNHPVANDIEALDALLALWAGLRRTSREEVSE